MKLRSALKWLVVMLVILVMVTLVVGTWLWRSEQGLKFAYGFAERFLPASISLSQPQGSFAGGVTIRRLSIDEPSAQLDAEAVGIDISLAGLLRGALVIDSLTLGRVTLDVSGASETGASEPAAEPLVVPLEINLEAFELTALTVRLPSRPPLELHAGGALRIAESDIKIEQLRLSGDWGESVVRASFNTISGAVDADVAVRVVNAAQPVAGEAQLRGNSASGYEYELALEQPQVLTVNGRYSNVAGVDATMRWSGQPIAGVPAGDLLTGGGRAQISGPLQRLNVAASTVLVWRDREPVTIDVEGVATELTQFDSQLSVGHPFANSDFGSRLRFLDQSIELSGSGSVRLPDLSQLDGASNGAMTLRFDLDATQSDTWNMSAAITEVSGDINEQPIAASANIDAGSAGWQLQDLEASIGLNTLTGRANGAGERLSWALQLAAPALDGLHQQLGGALNGDMTGTGWISAPTVQGALTSAALRVGDYEVSDLRMRFDTDASGEQTVQLVAGGISSPQIELQNTLLVGRGTTDSFSADLDFETLAHAINATTQLTRSASEVRMVVSDLTIEGSDIGALQLAAPAELVALERELRVTPTCLRSSGTARICGEGRFAPDTSFLDISLVDFPLSLMPLPPANVLTLSGLVNVEFAGRTEGELWYGNGKLLTRNAQTESTIAVDDGVQPTVQPFELTANVTIDRSQAIGDVLLDAGKFLNATGAFSVADVAQHDASADLVLQSRIESLAAWDAWLPELRIAAGSLESSLRFAIRDGERALGGEAQVMTGDIEWLPTGTRLDPVDLRLNSIGGNLWSLAGMLGSTSGRVSVDAEIDTSINAPKIEGRIHGEALQVLNASDLRVLAEPDIGFQITRSGTSIDGTLQVPEAAIALTELPDTAREVTPDLVIHREVEDEEVTAYPVSADIRVTLGDAVSFAGFGLSTKIQGELQLTQTGREAPQGFGELSLVDGEIVAYGQELAISRGRLVFSGSLENPVLDIEATRNVSVGRVGIRARGSADDPQSELFSEPAMSQARILSFLLSGRDLSESQADNEALSSAAISLGLTQVNAITAELGAKIGVDALAVGGTGDTREIFAGKWLSPDIYVQYGVGLFDRVGSFLVKYRLNSRLTLESRSGREQSLDLVYTVGEGRGGDDSN